MLEIRAHHLLCIPRFKGGGYTREHGRRWKEVCKSIRANPNQKIKVVKAPDFVCSACPYFGETICVKKDGINKWILRHDESVLKRLGLQAGAVYPAKEALALSIEKIGAEEIKKICRGCEFLEYCVESGFNKSFVRDLNKNRKSDQQLPAPC